MNWSVHALDASRGRAGRGDRLRLVEPVADYPLDAVVADMGVYDAAGTKEAAEL